jgi:hypothetical protein
MNDYKARIEIRVYKEICVTAPNDDVAFDMIHKEAFEEEQEVYNILNRGSQHVYDVSLDDDIEYEFLQEHVE